MVARRIDALIRSSFSSMSRRSLVRRVPGGLLAVLLLLSADERAGTKKRKKRKRKRCKNQETRCGKKCVRGSCCPGDSCALGCVCRRTIGGKTFCGPEIFMAICAQCQSGDDCQEDERCALDDQCGPGITAVCVPDCQA